MDEIPDGLALRVGNLSLDDSSHTLRIEGILHQNGDILVANRIDCRRIDHFRTEVTKLRSFHITQLLIVYALEITRGSAVMNPSTSVRISRLSASSAAAMIAAV
mgnify:CR=1 FL=1